MVIFQFGNVEISVKALERLKKDRRIKQKLAKYANVILMLINQGRGYQSEVIGQFFVSPRGRSDVRVAWWIEGNKLIIADLLYEIETGVYVDKWNGRAMKGEINKGTYQEVVPLSNTVFAGYI
ncbi:hypothetical protein HZB88_00025 [archaeon]|nr:hypothetical protein [archaeon]